MASALPSPVPAIVVPPPSFAVCPRAFPDAKFIVAMATNPPVIAVGEGGAPDSQEPVEQLLVGLTRIHTFGPHRVHSDVEARRALLAALETVLARALLGPPALGPAGRRFLGLGTSPPAPGMPMETFGFYLAGKDTYLVESVMPGALLSVEQRRRFRADPAYRRERPLFIHHWMCDFGIHIPDQLDAGPDDFLIVGDDWNYEFLGQPPPLGAPVGGSVVTVAPPWEDHVEPDSLPVAADTSGDETVEYEAGEAARVEEELLDMMEADGMTASPPFPGALPYYSPAWSPADPDLSLDNVAEDPPASLSPGAQTAEGENLEE